MANNNEQRMRPHRYENFNNLGACCLGVLQLLGGLAVIGLGIAGYLIIGELTYYGMPIWSGSVFFFTAITAFISSRKTMCGITTFLVTCMITTTSSAVLLVLYARILSQGDRYYYCDTRHRLNLKCLHYTSLTNLLILEACSLSLFALEFAMGAVGMALCLCGICRAGLSRTSDAAPAPVPATAPPADDASSSVVVNPSSVVVNPSSVVVNPISVSTPDPTVSVSNTGADHEFQVSLNFYSHEVTVPTAPPEHIVAEEQLQGNYDL